MQNKSKRDIQVNLLYLSIRFNVLGLSRNLALYYWNFATLISSRMATTVNSRSLINGLGRNSIVFYWKSTNLIGSPTVLYSPIENDRTRVVLKVAIFLDFKLRNA